MKFDATSQKRQLTFFLHWRRYTLTRIIWIEISVFYIKKIVFFPQESNGEDEETWETQLQICQEREVSEG